MTVLRTPDARFENLKDFPFEPNYLSIKINDELDVRQHYIEEGPADGETILLLHGEPSWSYLYRKMIPILVSEGFRVIAPDLIGFGKSDKLCEAEHYTYRNHVCWLTQFIHQKSLSNIHLFCQDWGGLLGLRIVSEQPDLFKSVTASNTALPNGETAMPDAFKAWQKYAAESPDFPIGEIIQRATHQALEQSVVAGYDAPFPDDSYKVAARIFPSLVPTSPKQDAAVDNQLAWKSLAKFNKPFLTLFGDKDPITSGVEKVMQSVIPGAKGQAHEILNNGGHFIQEDLGETLARKMATFIQSI